MNEVNKGVDPRLDYDRACSVRDGKDGLYEGIRQTGLDPDNIVSAVTLGTGLQGKFGERIGGDDAFSRSYQDIPLLEGNNTTQAPSHVHELRVGPLDGDEEHLVMAFFGRYHVYENLTPEACTFYVRLAKVMGVEALGITNAAGVLAEAKQVRAAIGLVRGLVRRSLRETFTSVKDLIKRNSIDVGDIVMIDDVVNFTGTSSLRGSTENMWGEAFMSPKDMLPEWIIEEAKQIVREELGWEKDLESGIYLQDRADLRRYQAPAESMFLQLLADMVGKSTVVELEAAHEVGIRDKFAMTNVTNVAFGLDIARQADVTSGHVEEVGAQSAEKVTDLTVALLKRIREVRLAEAA